MRLKKIKVKIANRTHKSFTGLYIMRNHHILHIYCQYMLVNNVTVQFGNILQESSEHF